MKFFSEEKNQKTFMSGANGTIECGAGHKRFLASFFSKKKFFLFVHTSVRQCERVPSPALCPRSVQTGRLHRSSKKGATPWDF
jgi:hypothetical protein